MELLALPFVPAVALGAAALHSWLSRPQHDAKQRLVGCVAALCVLAASCVYVFNEFTSKSQLLSNNLQSEDTGGATLLNPQHIALSFVRDYGVYCLLLGAQGLQLGLASSVATSSALSCAFLQCILSLALSLTLSENATLASHFMSATALLSLAALVGCVRLFISSGELRECVKTDFPELLPLIESWLGAESRSELRRQKLAAHVAKAQARAKLC